MQVMLYVCKCDSLCMLVNFVVLFLLNADFFFNL